MPKVNYQQEKHHKESKKKKKMEEKEIHKQMRKDIKNNSDKLKEKLPLPNTK